MIDSFLLEGVVNLFLLPLLLSLLVKSILVGSDFSIYEWLKHGKTYTGWYFNRKKFNPKEREDVKDKDI